MILVGWEILGFMAEDFPEEDLDAILDNYQIKKSISLRKNTKNTTMRLGTMEHILLEVI